MLEETIRRRGGLCPTHPPHGPMKSNITKIRDVERDIVGVYIHLDLSTLKQHNANLCVEKQDGRQTDGLRTRVKTQNITTVRTWFCSCLCRSSDLLSADQKETNQIDQYSPRHSRTYLNRRVTGHDSPFPLEFTKPSSAHTLQLLKRL